jgi:F-box protein 3
VLDADGALVDEVSGDGVVGLFPLLMAGGAEVSYQSCTVVTPPARRGAMEGSFEFVEGSLAAQTGPRFRVACPRMQFEVPDYCY